MKQFLQSSASCLCVLALSACGGGGGGSTTPTSASQTSAAAPVTITQPDPAPAPAPAPAPDPTPTPTPAPAETVTETALKPDGWKAMVLRALNLRQQNKNAAWSYALMSDGARRYELRGGDDMSATPSGTERSESYDPFKMLAAKTYQFSFKMMIEPGETNKASWLLVTQLTSELDPGEAPHSPPFAIEMNGDKLRIVSRDSSAKLSTAADTRYVRQYNDTKPMTRGQWYELRVQVAMGPFGNGMLKVWRDNALLVNFTGAIGFNDIVGPYFKQGIYRSATNQTIAIQFKDLQFGQVD